MHCVAPRSPRESRDPRPANLGVNARVRRPIVKALPSDGLCRIHRRKCLPCLLLAAGHRVLGLDNINDAYDPRLKTWRLAALQAAKRASSSTSSISPIGRWSANSLFDTRATSGTPPFAAVFHLAARTGVRPSVENPWIYVDTNITGTLNVLDGCRRAEVPKFVLASTSSIYGADARFPFARTPTRSRPLSPYAASKKAAEVLAYSYHALHGLDVSVLRYFTVYGPAGRPDMSIFRFIRQIAEGEPLVVFGDGSQRRDFTYVEDIARGTIAAARPLGYEIINLGGDRPVRALGSDPSHCRADRPQAAHRAPAGPCR